MSSCDPNELLSCLENQVCVETKDHKGECQCITGYIFDEQLKKCMESSDSSSTGTSSATVVTVTLLTLTLITITLVLIVRRYDLISWLRQKMSRRDNSVMYEDVMIGQDDPPIAA